ncbi:MAG: autotransporter-associated beta strand repeat-containing protein [Phycisphaerales bacterium JB043]
MRTKNMTIGTLVALAGLASTAASAQEWISSAPGEWNDAANWSTPSAPNGVGVPATIYSTITGGSLSSSGIISFNSPVTVGDIVIDLGVAGPTLSLATQTLTLDNGGGTDIHIMTYCAYPITINGQIVLMGDLVSNWRASNGAINASISGSYGVIHDADFEGRLRLYGNNTYIGPTIVRRGRLSIQSASNLGGPESATIVEAAGTLILETNSNPTINAEPVEIQDNGRFWMLSGNWTSPITIVSSARFTPWFDDNEGEISGLVTGAGVFKKMSAQSWQTNDDTKETILTLSNSANDYTGGTVIEGGVLQILDDGALGVVGTSVTFDKDGFNEGSSALATMSDMTVARDIVMVDPGWLRAGAATTGTYTGVVSGSKSLDIGFLDWSGIVALAGDNTYSGGTVVRAGTMLAMNSTGSATGSGNVVVDPGATIGGTGTVSGDVVLAGATVAPGASAGTLTVGGLSMDASSSMDIEIGGSGTGEFDRLVSTGSIELAGTLTASLIDTYELQDGDEFEIINAPSITGSFDTLNLGPNLKLTMTTTTVTLSAINITPACDADLNGDSLVDGADLGLLLGAWGGAGSADLNSDGTVNGSDLGLLLGAWGACP